MRRASVLAVVLALVVLTGASDDVGYPVVIDAPQMQPEGFGIVRGVATIRVRAGEGVGEPLYASYHARSPGTSWVEEQAVAMQQVEPRSFASVESPWDTLGLENGDYRLEVRVYGDVPPYDPTQPRTYARQVMDVKVDNAPPRPARPSGTLTPGSLVVSWEAVPTADRGDFAGYEVWRQRRRKGCAPRLAHYRRVATTTSTVYAEEDAAPGRHCFRVVALRRSGVTGTIASAASGTVALIVEAAAPPPSVRREDPRRGPGPPTPPSLGDAQTDVSDGDYGDRLPYGSRRVKERVVTEVIELRDVARRVASPDPRRTPASIAAGLILLIAALLVRRVLDVDPPAGA